MIKATLVLINAVLAQGYSAHFLMEESQLPS